MKLFLLSILFLQTSAPASDLLWRPKVGENLTYAVEMDMAVEKNAFTYTTQLGLNVVEVKRDGSYVVESGTKNSRVKAGNQTFAAEDSPSRRELFTPMGHRALADSPFDSDPLNRVLSSVCEFSPPGKKVQVGATWSTTIKPDSRSGRPGSASTYVLKSLDKDGAWIVAFSYKELGGSPPPDAEGEFLIDSRDSTMVGFTATIHNVIVDPTTPPAAITIRMARVQQKA